MLGPTLLTECVPRSECLLSALKILLPHQSWVEFVGQDWNEVFDRPAKHALSWGDCGVGVGRIPVLQQGSLECVSVEVATAVHVAGDDSLGSLDSHLCTAIAVGKCY